MVPDFPVHGVGRQVESPGPGNGAKDDVRFAKDPFTRLLSVLLCRYGAEDGHPALADAYRAGIRSFAVVLMHGYSYPSTHGGLPREKVPSFVAKKSRPVGFS
ncbi:MAG: hypothetical protein IPM60_12865 [Rhodospirillales bacterium]|nr:hypothetical protein [Rhodospirillales bacterium]